MKRIAVIGLALVFALGVAGLGFGADKEMSAMKHDDAKVCSNVNCCGTPEKAKESAIKEETKSSTSWLDQLKIGADGPTVR